MTKVVQSIYAMLGPFISQSDNDAKEKAKVVFQYLDTDGDLVLSEDEFVQGCMKNKELKSLLAPVMVSDGESV